MNHGKHLVTRSVCIFKYAAKTILEASLLGIDSLLVKLTRVSLCSFRIIANRITSGHKHDIQMEILKF
ncbi:hypothetical protein BgiBS90_028569 [Biomphalaria glabrata]|nr:hypothetical protein BgiBS90_028569 [Biomphalaria glabrata]